MSRVAQKLTGMTPQELLDYNFQRVECAEDLCLWPGGPSPTHLGPRLLPTHADLRKQRLEKQSLLRPYKLS